MQHNIYLNDANNNEKITLGVYFRANEVIKKDTPKSRQTQALDKPKLFLKSCAGEGVNVSANLFNNHSSITITVRLIIYCT